MTISEALELVQHIGHCEGAEYGEYCAYLAEFYNNHCYDMSDEFKKAYENELLENAEYIKENYTYVDKTIVSTQVVQQLVHKDNI